MDVVLTPQLEEIIKDKVASGDYDDANAVIREALALLDERDRSKELRAAVAIGIEQADRGELVPLDMAAAKRAASEQSRRGHKVDPLVLP